MDMFTINATIEQSNSENADIPYKIRVAVFLILSLTSSLLKSSFV